MFYRRLIIIPAFFLVFWGCSKKSVVLAEKDSLIYPEENYFSDMRQLSFGGDNAEAYWSFDGEMLVLQRAWKEKGIECDQIYTMDPANPGEFNLVSTGKGRTTCSYFLPGDTLIVYASTHHASEECPPAPHRGPEGEYVWPIYPSYDIYVADLKGNIIKQLTTHDGYDAEATVSPKGDKIVFTSMRSGDLELYTMDLDGGNIFQVTDEPGYDGGAFFSPDGEWLVFRSSRPQTGEEKDQYFSLLKRGLVQPTEMELYICRTDGSELQRVTDLGNANWAPFFHPSGEKIIFSSNHHTGRGFPFNLFMINTDGTGLEQVTYDDTFDSFPMFSQDGSKLVFSSNRNNGGTRDTNIFVTEWKD